MALKQICILFLIITLTGCGNNLFESFDDEENSSDNLVNQLEYAQDDADLAVIIEKADDIINDPNNTNSEIGEAQLIKAEAIVSKAGLSPLDILGDIGETVDDPNINNFNALNIDSDKKDALIEAANEIENASNNGVQGDNDQNLMKGITNLGVVSAVVDESLIISDNGTVERTDPSKSFFQTLNTVMYPDPTNTTKTTLDYAADGFTGLVDSNSFTDDQENEMEEIKEDIDVVNDLFNAAKNGQVYTSPSGSTFNFSGNVDSDGDLSSQNEQDFIEQELSNIFGN